MAYAWQNGPAPELTQVQAVAEERAKIAAALNAVLKKYWIQDAGSPHGVKLVTSLKVQKLLDESDKDFYVMPEDQSTGWVLASDAGFNAELSEEETKTSADEVKEIESLSSEEVQLETLPDDDLIALATKFGIFGMGLPKLSRSQMIEALAKKGATPGDL